MPNKSTLTIWVLEEVILVIILGVVPHLQRGQFGNDWALHTTKRKSEIRLRNGNESSVHLLLLLSLGHHFLSDLLLLRRGVEDG